MEHNTYPAGFMSPRPNWSKAFRALEKDLLIVAADVAAIVCLWALCAFIWNHFAHGARDFSSLPWWLLFVLGLELAVLWQSFGRSLGQRLMRRHLVDRRTEHSLPRRTLRAALLHLQPLYVVSILPTARHVPWHDRWTGFEMAGESERTQDQRLKWYRQSSSMVLLLLALSMFFTSALFTQVDLVRLATNASATTQIWQRILNPDWSILPLGFRLLIVTLYMAFMATLFGVLVAVPLSFLAARNLTRGWIGRIVYTIIRVVLSVVRSIEPIIWAIIFVVWVRTGNAPFAGTLALFVHSVADLGKLYSERLESIDPGPVEAIRATGANSLQVILYGIVPQIVNPYLSFTIYRWDINVRMATIIGLVGGGGIGQRLIQLTRNWVWDQAIVLMMIIMVVVWAMDHSSSKLRERLN